MAYFGIYDAIGAFFMTPVSIGRAWKILRRILIRLRASWTHFNRPVSKNGLYNYNPRNSGNRTFGPVRDFVYISIKFEALVETKEKMEPQTKKCQLAALFFLVLLRLNRCVVKKKIGCLSTSEKCQSKAGHTLRDTKATRYCQYVYNSKSVRVKQTTHYTILNFLKQKKIPIVQWLQLRV